MVNKTLTNRLKALEQAVKGVASLVGALMFDDRAETPLAAVRRADGPGLYLLCPSSLNEGFLCQIKPDGTASMFASNGREVAPW